VKSSKAQIQSKFHKIPMMRFEDQKLKPYFLFRAVYFSTAFQAPQSFRIFKIGFMAKVLERQNTG
jgi:hypothetical protein